MRSIILSLLPQINTCFRISQMRNYARYISGENIVNLNHHTLTGRLMIYLKPHETENNKTAYIDTKETLKELQRPTKSVNVSTDKLIALIKSLEDQDLIKNNKSFYKALQVVDTECCSRYKNETCNVILEILDAFMDLIPSRITELKFYKLALTSLLSARDELKGKNYMRFLFYIALMKKSTKSQKMMRDALSVLKHENINHLSTEDLCIIANSAFKTSTKISNKHILNKIANYLSDNLMLLKDPAVFITLIKSLRHNRYCGEDLLSTISHAIFFNKTFEYYTFQTYCHILAFYSDNLYHDEALMEFFTRKCIEEMKTNSSDMTGSHQIRLKDIVRFLWGMANLNCNYLQKEDLKIVFIPKILELINKSNIDVNSIIDICLNLWILNYRCYELIPYLLQQRNVLLRIPDKSNERQRLNQLLTCIYHEDLPLFRKIDLRPQGTSTFILSQHLRNRPWLQSVLRSLKSVGHRMGITFEIGYQIPSMNILGITGCRKQIYKVVNIELLDDFTTLKNTENKPSGFMQMKLRILDGLEEALIVIKQKEIEDMTEAELEEFLQAELDLVC